MLPHVKILHRRALRRSSRTEKERVTYRLYRTELLSLLAEFRATEMLRTVQVELAVGSDLQPGALDAASGSVADEKLISALRYVWETQRRVWPPLALIRVRGTIQPSGSGLNIYSRFHFQLKRCITVSHLLLCTTNTSTGYCYSLFCFFYFKYLYTYLTNVLKKCYFAFKPSSGFVACVQHVCVRACSFRCLPANIQVQQRPWC